MVMFSWEYNVSKFCIFELLDNNIGFCVDSLSITTETSQEDSPSKVRMLTSRSFNLENQ